MTAKNLLLTLEPSIGFIFCPVNFPGSVLLGMTMVRGGGVNEGASPNVGLSTESIQRE